MTHLPFPTLFKVSKDDERNEETKIQEKSNVPLDEGASAPKAKLSWAALFKSNSDAPMPKSSTIVSVNYPEATSKAAAKDACKVANDQQSDFVPDKSDNYALALAGIVMIDGQYMFCPTCLYSQMLIR